VVLLGSTGSIGVNTLKIATEFNLEVEALVAGSNIALLNRQIATHHPKVVAIANEADVINVQHDNVLVGQEGIEKIIEEATSDVVVNALVGFLGLAPTIKSLERGKKVALANKESLVVAGKFIDTSNIIPIDSEHFALWYLLQDKAMSKMTITASGGAFRDWSEALIPQATLSDALKHPNWSMGQKITVDSATMVNKLFELLETKWLYSCENLDAIIETKSLIHALIDFKDGSSTAHLAYADMRLPIAYALLGRVDKAILRPIDLVQVGSLEFRQITPERYPIWEIKDAILAKPELGVVINAANEVAIEAFVANKIRFGEISQTIIRAFKKYEHISINSLEEVFKIDQKVRDDFKYRE
jgi:1-deoxy-D-xylulose-5-phosphate reductoisomerase